VIVYQFLVQFIALQICNILYHSVIIMLYVLCVCNINVCLHV